LTSPASETDWPALSVADSPLITKPPVPAATALRFTACVPVRPKTTKLRPAVLPPGAVL